MSHTLQFSFVSSAFNYSMKMEKMKRVRPRGFQFLCSSEHSSFKDEDDAENGGSDTSLFGCFVLLRKLQRVNFSGIFFFILSSFDQNSILVYEGYGNVDNLSVIEKKREILQVDEAFDYIVLFQFSINKIWIIYLW